MKNKGFSLIEVLVSLGILAILSSAILGIVFVVFRSSEKAEKVKKVKQNGEIAVSILSDFIRRSQSVDSCLSDSLEVTHLGEITIFKIDDDGVRIASNSAYLTSGEVKCSELSFNCTERGISSLSVDFSFKLSLLDDSYSDDFSGRVLLLK